MANHAMLSASGASRWLTCSPSARFEKEFPEQQSDYADEGTLAHELASYVIAAKASETLVEPHVLERIQADKHYSSEMSFIVDEYADFVIERFREASKGAMLVLEQRVDLRMFIPEGFGTVDVGIPADYMLDIIDLKYGQGVPVDAEENPQIMLYALGILQEYKLLYDIKRVRMTIYQPRLENISTFEMSAENLERWGYEVVIPGALKAYKGEGEFIPGDHCRFCRAKAQCKAAAKFNLELAARDFAAPVNLVSDEQVVRILGRAASMKKWLTSVEEMALRMALGGKVWPGLKVVAGKSMRKYTNEQAIKEGLIEAGYQEDLIVNKKLTGITDLSSKITKLDFQKYVDPHIVKPPGSPALVPVTDKRPAFNSSEAAAKAFLEE